MAYPPGPYGCDGAADRPDLLPQFGPTVEACQSMPLDCGNQIGIAIRFRGSGYRHACRGTVESEVVDGIKEYVAAAPYGRNRFGRPWEPRET